MSNQFDTAFRLINSAFFGKFLFQIGLLFVCKPFSDAIKPLVDCFGVSAQFRNAFLIEQRCYRTIFHSPLHGIGM